jgi:Rad3-related DNA helicase
VRAATWNASPAALIIRLPVPEGWDRQGIGRRFFAFPEKSLKDDEVEELRRSLMKAAGRSLVLTPSFDSASAVSEDVTANLKYPVYSGPDLEDRKSAFVASSSAVAVVANRYDGIDFPDDDCRLLFVEGLPRAANLQERFLMNRMGTNLLFNERVQTRILQAVGRCTRGLNDYSAVVVTGEDLPAYLTDRKRRSRSIRNFRLSLSSASTSQPGWMQIPSSKTSGSFWSMTRSGRRPTRASSTPATGAPKRSSLPWQS